MSASGISTTLIAIRTRRAPDERVLAEALEGDPMAFSEFYRRYHTRIRGYCLARLRDATAADDAAQEVFLRVLRAEDSQVRNPKSWLFAIASNVIADVGRKRSAQPDTVMTADEPSLNITTGRDSAAEVIDRETARNVFTALRRLAPRQRTALILRELHGQTSAEIAEALETSVGNSDVLVSRARDSFGDAYAEVGNLPQSCREAVAAIYRDGGTGITPAEKTSLSAHMDACPRCTAEYRRAHSKRYLPSLVPFLVPASTQTDLLARASVWLRNIPESALVHVANLSTPAKVGAATLAAAIAIVPVAGVIRAESPRVAPPVTTPLEQAVATPRIDELQHSTDASSHLGDSMHASTDTHASETQHHATRLADTMHATDTHTADSHTSSTAPHTTDTHMSTTTTHDAGHDMTTDPTHQ